MNLKHLVAVIAVFASLPAFAGSVDRRACRQQERIEQGVRSGELTRPEAFRLERHEARLDREITRDRLSGRGFSAHERAKVERQENRFSRDIYRQKHDGQYRF